MFPTEFGFAFFEQAKAILREVEKAQSLIPTIEESTPRDGWNPPTNHPFGDWVLGEFETSMGTTLQGPAFCSSNGRWMRAGSHDGHPAFIEHEPIGWRYFSREIEADRVMEAA
jgi:hypothetical protein